MIERRVLIALVGAATLLTSHLAASAEERGARMEAHFKAADKNGDGMLDREEASAMPRVAANFDAIDGDKSGAVTEKEIHDYMKAHRQERRKN